MTIEADIYTATKSLVSNRVFPDVAPAGVGKPYVVFQQIGGEAVNVLTQTISSKKNGRFQFAAWGTTRAAVSALMLDIESALVLSALFDARPIGAATSTFDSDAGLYGSRQDFSIWSNR
jgi:hypothetical protein